MNNKGAYRTAPMRSLIAPLLFTYGINMLSHDVGGVVYSPIKILKLWTAVILAIVILKFEKWTLWYTIQKCAHKMKSKTWNHTFPFWSILESYVILAKHETNSSKALQKHCKNLGEANVTKWMIPNFMGWPFIDWCKSSGVGYTIKFWTSFYHHAIHKSNLS